MEVSGQRHGPRHLPPRKEHPVPTGEEAGWAPETVLTLPIHNLHPSYHLKLLALLSSEVQLK
jgi:hypothetical protein